MNSTASNNTIECGPGYVFTVLFPCLYSGVFLVALTLNIMAAWIFFNLPTNSTFVVYLKNLVVADLLMTLTLPVKVLYYVGVRPRVLAVAYCRYSTIVFYLTMYISIAFLCLISLDRYLKIVWPFREFSVQKVRVGQLLSAAVWLVLSSLAMAIIILANNSPPKLTVAGPIYCGFLMSESVLVVFKATTYICQVVFWVTLVLMVACYSFISRAVYKSYKASRSSSSEVASRKTNAKVFVLLAVFLVCFAPYHFYTIPYYMLTQTSNPAKLGCAENITLYNAQVATLWLLSTNACLDPVIYVLLCKKFRTQLVATLSTCKTHPA